MKKMGTLGEWEMRSWSRRGGWGRFALPDAKRLHHHTSTTTAAAAATAAILSVLLLLLPLFLLLLQLRILLY